MTSPKKSMKPITTSEPHLVWICSSTQLPEGSYRKIQVAHDGQHTPVVIFRYQGRCLAFKNQCVHMPRALDCEEDMIFDATGRFLRCSMHGIVYDPVSGESRSEICHGQRLTAIGTREDAQGVWIDDHHVTALERIAAGTPPSKPRP